MKQKKDKKMILATGFTIFALLSTMCATFAWFLIPKPNLSLDTVSGDMSISLERLSAYRYVYPFYKDSNSYIDYSEDANGKDKGKLKEFVIKNKDEIEPLDTAPTINTEGSFTKTALYLVGDKTYLGDSSQQEFALSSGVIFSSSTDGLVFTMNSINLSIGSHITVARNDGTIVPFTNVTKTNLEEGDFEYSNSHFTCKKAGIYDFKIKKSSDAAGATYNLEITYQSRDDEAILGMTLFDPTYALLKGTTNDLKGRSTAIYEQNTCLIYDIEIKVKNQTRNFSLSLDVKRNALSDENGKNKENEYNLSKYVTYRFKEYEEGDEISTLFTSTFHNYTKSDATAIYNYPDNITTSDSSNSDSTSSTTTSTTQEEQTVDESDTLSTKIETLVFKDNSDTKLSLFKDKKPDSYDSEYRSFHFYIAIDYSPVAIEYFFKENQLNKEYNLIRDYTFYFSSIQQISDGGNA